MKPTVSVILTSYNHGKFIADSIKSVLDQSFTDFEVIIIDDCSTDSSWDVISSFKDPRIVKIRNKTRCHAVKGQNAAIKDIAKGEFVAIHHSDDLFCPNKLQVQLDTISSMPEVGAVFTKVTFIDDEGSKLEEKTEINNVFDVENRSRHEWLRHFFYKGNCLCHPSILIRKSCYEKLGYYDMRLASLPDFDMWIRFCLNYDLHIIPEKLFKFRTLSGGKNVSGDNPVTYIRSLNELAYVYANYRKLTDVSEFKRIFSDDFAYVPEIDRDIPFVLAIRAALTNEQSVYAMGLKIFGLNLLYELFSDEKYAFYIKNKYEFDYLDLIELSSCTDVYDWRRIVYKTDRESKAKQEKSMLFKLLKRW